MTEEAPAIDIGLLHPYLYNSTRITDCQGINKIIKVIPEFPVFLLPLSFLVRSLFRLLKLDFLPCRMDKSQLPRLEFRQELQIYDRKAEMDKAFLYILFRVLDVLLRKLPVAELLHSFPIGSICQMLLDFSVSSSNTFSPKDQRQHPFGWRPR